MIIDCIGCLHGHYPKLEGGDLLIVTGDLTARDTGNELMEFVLWTKQLRYKKIIVIAGNHDISLKFNDECCVFNTSHDSHIQYLCDSGTEFEGLKIWGSPWTKTFPRMNPKCKAFTVDTDDELFEKWKLIPDDIDILITHGPAYGILDGIPIIDGSLFHVGSTSLHGWLKYTARPKLHVFSHVHEGYGEEEFFPTYDNNMMKSINCSHVNEKYQPVNKPIRVIL